MISTRRLEPGKWYIEYDETGKVVGEYHDPAYCRILGYASEQEYIEAGLHWIDTIHPEDVQRVSGMISRVKQKHPKGMDFDAEYRRMTRNGYRWFHDFGRCERRSDGSLIKIDGVIFDIQATVDREEAHQALIENNARILALEDRFESLYDVDLETGKYEMYVRGKTTGNVHSRMVNTGNFFSDMLENVDRVVYYDDRVGMKSVLDLEYIREMLETNRHYDLHFRLLMESGNVWVRMRVLYKNAERDHIIVGIFNNEEEMALKRQEERRAMELAISRFRTETLAYVADHDPDPVKFMEYFGKSFLKLSGCDQIVFRDTEGKRFILNAPGIDDIPRQICDGCPFSDMHSHLYDDDGHILMDDCFKGRHRVLTHPDCPAKSSFMQQVWSDGKLRGLLSVHYMKERHTFQDIEVDMMKDVAAYMGLMMSRLDAKRTEMEKAEAESDDREKTDLLANMSHDLQASLSEMISLTEAALKHVENRDAVREYLEKTGNAARELLKKVSSLPEKNSAADENALPQESPRDISV